MGHTLKEGWKVEVRKKRGGKGGDGIWEGKGIKRRIEGKTGEGEGMRKEEEGENREGKGRRNGKEGGQGQDRDRGRRKGT